MAEIYRVPQPGSSDGRFIKLKEYLINAVNPEMQKQSAFQQGGRAAIRQLLLDAFTRTRAELPPEARDYVLESALADLVGYGPLEPLLADPEISEIMVNGPKNVFVERVGEVLETDVRFDDDDHLLR